MGRTAGGDLLVVQTHKLKIKQTTINQSISRTEGTMTQIVRT
jgi:hypothetical protein